MFDFAWSEIAVIAAVALVVIGPKDLPVAIKAISGFIKKARRMAAEFQTHVDEMVRDADLKDVKHSLDEIRNLNLKATVEQMVDPDGTIRGSFSPDPSAPPADTTPVEPDPDDGWGVEPAPPPPTRVPAPAFVPPALVPLAAGPDRPAPPPPFIPPAPGPASFQPGAPMLQRSAA